MLGRSSGAQNVVRVTRSAVATRKNTQACSATPVSWADRADAALRRMLSGDDGETAARTIQGILHPTGRDANLRVFDVHEVGDVIVVQISVDWRGCVGTDRMTTTVEWRFDEHDLISSEVVFDEGILSASRSSRQLLDGWFRTELHRVLRNNVANGVA